MQNDPPSPRPTRHAQGMNPPNRVSPRAAAQAGSMSRIVRTPVELSAPHSGAGCHPAPHPEAMSHRAPRNSPRAAPHREAMNEHELHYRQSVIALIALALWLLVVVVACHFLGPVGGVAVFGAAVPLGVAFYRALPEIGRGK